ncbi:MAG: terminase family protein [Betaproteobacteria bacterium]|jgi:hypothetical protein
MSQSTLKNIIASEYRKCALDPEYFLRKYCHIQVPNKGRMLFNLRPYQAEALSAFQEHQYNIVLKGRQIGISTLISGYALWRLLFNTDENILVIAIKQDVAKNIITKVKFMHSLLPTWLKSIMVEDNKLSIRFKNGSQMKAEATSEDSGRSESLSLLILDEAAFINEAEEIWTAAQSTLAETGGSVVLISTPNGMGNFFHKTWIDSEAGENDFNRMLFDWRVHEGRDQEWADQQLRNMGEMRFAQEHGASFIFSGNTVVSPEIIQYYKETFQQDPIAKEGFDQNIWIWEYPDYTKSYILAADVARGDGLDYSTFHIIDIEESRQVAEYKGKIPTKDFGNLLVEIGTKYNDALIIPDNANIGWACIQQILDRDYGNLFFMSKDLKFVDVQRQIVSRYYSEEKKMVPGFTISQRTRPLIIAKLESYMREQSIILHSSRTLTELETFVWKNSKPEAIDGYNDDLILALCIGLWVRDTALRLHAEGQELHRSMLGNFSTVYQKYQPLMASEKKEDPYKVKIGNKVAEDMRWLL